VPHIKRRIVKSDKEYSFASGIDFLDVACVLNFDLPSSARSYTHRARRSQRDRTFLFASAVPQFGKHKVVGVVPSTQHDEEAWECIARAQQGRVLWYVFDKKQVDRFRYRMEDALRAVMRYAVREARVREIKQELLVSDKLKVGVWCVSRGPPRFCCAYQCAPLTDGGVM
jgi:ATP-dependent RNA helicase DDX56/DBP9